MWEHEGPGGNLVFQLKKFEVPQHDAFISIYIPHLPTDVSHICSARWLKSVKTIKCKFSTSSLTECMWRRFQVNDQQAERQKKNVLQRALAFSSRADEILSKDRLFNTVMIMKNSLNEYPVTLDSRIYNRNHLLGSRIKGDHIACSSASL